MTITPTWVTYAEAADILRIKPASVKRRSMQRKWPRMVGNDGKARIQIPLDFSELEAKANTDDVTSDATGAITSDRGDTPITPDQSALIAQLTIDLAISEATCNGLRDRLSDTQAERDRLQHERDQLRAELNRLADMERAERERLSRIVERSLSEPQTAGWLRRWFRI